MGPWLYVGREGVTVSSAADTAVVRPVVFPHFGIVPFLLNSEQ